jgi:hypothetical protein
MTVYAVTRHSGALQWLTEEGVQYHYYLAHFDQPHLRSLHAGDRDVAGGYRQPSMYGGCRILEYCSAIILEISVEKRRAQLPKPAGLLI